MGKTQGWRVAFAIALVATLLYGGTVDHGYVLDDRNVVQENAVINEGRFVDALTTSYWPAELRAGASNWRPLATLGWTIERALAGPPTLRRDGSPTGGALPIHHGLNALLHGLCVLALFPLAWRLLRDRRAAWIACALFAVHPGHTEAVGPVVGRTDLLAALGALCTVEAWCRFRETRTPAWLAAAAAAFALGLGGKESAAPVLLMLPLADRWLMGRPWSDLRSRRALAYAPLLGVALIYGLARIAVLGGEALAHQQAVPLGVVGRAGFAGRNTVLSALLLLFPVRFHHLITTVPSDAPFTYPQPGAAMSAVWAVLALPIWLGWIPLWRRAPRAAFCWIAALAHWGPTSGLLPVAAGMALRFLFIPSAFVACGVVLGGVALMRWRPSWRNAVLVTAAAWGVVAVGLTLWRVPVWRSNTTFYEAVLREVPDAYTANYGLGSQIAERGEDMQRARIYFERAIRIAGDSDRGIAARTNLARSYEFSPDGRVEWGPGSEPETAVRIYQEALVVKPDSASAHRALGRLSEHLGRKRVALDHFLAVLRLQPHNPQASDLHGKCGQLLRELGRLPEAAGHFRTAMALREARAAEWLRRGNPGESARDLWFAIGMGREALAIPHAGAQGPDLAAAIARLVPLTRARCREAAQAALAAAPTLDRARRHEAHAKARQLLEWALALEPTPAEAAEFRATLDRLGLPR